MDILVVVLDLIHDDLMHDARCETIDTSNIVDINKYMMDKHNIVEILLF